MKTVSILLLLFLFVSGCTKPALVNRPPEVEKHPFTVYQIKKGNHSAAGNHFMVLGTGMIRCEVVFDSSAVYQSVNEGNQDDVNKLIGFSDCNEHHQHNSARIGWSWNGKSIILYAYAYINKERVIKTLAAVSLNQPVTCTVNATGDKYFFMAGQVTDSLPRHCADFSGSRYKLYPYFGGDEKAPHDINIRIREF